MTKSTKTKNELSLSKRITKEEKRLRESYYNLSDDVMRIVDGLIKRAAHMRIMLEEYENDLLTGGYVEMFTQSQSTEPYERERPVARLYSTMNKNYQSIISQLARLLPKDTQKPEDDGFDAFTRKRI